MSDRKNICLYNSPNTNQLNIFTEEMIEIILNETTDKTVIQKFD